jgi:hypothetical protein
MLERLRDSWRPPNIAHCFVLYTTKPSPPRNGSCTTTQGSVWKSAKPTSGFTLSLPWTSGILRISFSVTHDPIIAMKSVIGHQSDPSRDEPPTRE